MQNPSRSRAQLIWPVLGGIFLLTQIYVYAAWILSDDFRATDVGPDPLPVHSLIGLRVYEIISIGLALYLVPWFFIGLRKAGRIDHFRLMMLGWFATWWTDPWLNFLRPMFTYNAYMFNRGCWCEFIPGWQSENGSRIAEPLIVDGMAYFFTFAATVWTALKAMQWSQGKWPGRGNAWLCFVGFASVWITMGLLDIFATRVLYFDAWPGAFHTLSFWGGDFYQFPIYEFILFPAIFVACAFVILYPDPDGTTVVERGVRGLQLKNQKLESSLRILAFVGLCNVLNLGYTTAMGIHALHVDPWPETTPSWLANEQCGTITGIECE